MKFEEAAKSCLKKGHKFRRVGSSAFKEGIRKKNDGTDIIEFFNIDTGNSLKEQSITLWDLESDWEIIKEKKTLADKEINASEDLRPAYYKSDVKATLKEFIEWLKIDKAYCEKATEIFGEDLLN